MFYDLDPLARAAIFGAIFLGSLGLVLWLWWDTSNAYGNTRWIWRVAASTFVVLTIPAVVLGAANLDSSRETLLNIFAWTSIGSAVLALITVALYGTMGRQAGAPALPAQPWPAEPSPFTEPGPPLPPPTRPRPNRPAVAYLVVKSGPDQGKQFSVFETTTVGRGRNCTIILADGRVSESHAQLKLTGEDVVFTDMGSTNGSFLRVGGDERPIHRPQPLVDGDELRIGRTVVQFLDARHGRSR